MFRICCAEDCLLEPDQSDENNFSLVLYSSPSLSFASLLLSFSTSPSIRPSPPKIDEDRKWQRLLVNDYVELLSFFEADCCFSEFRGDARSSSIRLNALAFDLLHLAGVLLDERYLVIDRNAMRSAIEYVLKQQSPNGAFLESEFNPLLYKMFPDSDYKSAQLLMQPSAAIRTLDDYTGRWQKESWQKERWGEERKEAIEDQRATRINSTRTNSTDSLKKFSTQSAKLFNEHKQFAKEDPKEDQDRFAKSENNFGFRCTPVALTAKVLVSLNRIETADSKLSLKIEKAIARAAAYLEANLVQLDSSYEIAISTFALLTTPKALRNSDPQLAVEMLRQRARYKDAAMMYWSRIELDDVEYEQEMHRTSVNARRMQRFDSEAVETSAYALLVYNRLNLPHRHMIARYLNYVRLHSNGFVTPSDTLVALESLIDYSLDSKSDHRAVTDMNIEYRFSSDPVQRHELRIRQENSSEQHCLSLTDQVHGHLIVHARGSGVALMQLKAEYTVTKRDRLIQPKVRAFQLDVRWV